MDEGRLSSIVKQHHLCGTKQSFVATSVKLTTDSATDSDFLRTSSLDQLWDAKHENDLYLNFQGQIQSQMTGYPILSRNYVQGCTKMVSNDS